MISPIRAEVSAAALRHNLARIRQEASGARVMAVVKANAYGHGLVEVARALGDADAFGVSRLPEALTLRMSGIGQRIVLLEGLFEGSQLIEAASRQLDLVVHCEEQLAQLESCTPPRPFDVWLKINTGMNRLGFRPEEVAGALGRLDALGPRVVRMLRVMTHFSAADEADSPATRQQIDDFARLAAQRSWERSLCNSAGVFACPEAHAEWVRPGLSLYGVSPFPELLGAQLGLKPVMRLVSTVIAVRRVPQGEGVGYGGVWRAPQDTSVAIVAAGYGDGLPRSLPAGTPVLVRGQRAGVVGRVSMDMMAVDVGHLPTVRVGDGVVLWGSELPVEEIAAHAATIPYELLCGISQRVPLAWA